MGVRSPVYFEGITGSLFKDRGQFYSMWPRYPTQFQHFVTQNEETTRVVSFTMNPVPFLPHEVVIGGVSTTNAPIRINDDGFGNLLLQIPNPQVSLPTSTTNVPGIKNINTGNPGDEVQTIIGTVDYVTGAVTMNFPIGTVPLAGTVLNCWVSQYSPGRPYTLLFWNNEFSIRPVPDNVYKVEVETYLTPVIAGTRVE